MPDPQPGDADPVDNQILWPRLNFGSHLPYNRRFWDRHLRSLKAFLTHYRCTIDALSTHLRAHLHNCTTSAPLAVFFFSPLCFVHQTQAYIFFFHFSHLFLWVVCRCIPGKLSQIRLWLISHQPPFFFFPPFNCLFIQINLRLCLFKRLLPLHSICVPSPYKYQISLFVAVP